MHFISAQRLTAMLNNKRTLHAQKIGLGLALLVAAFLIAAQLVGMGIISGPQTEQTDSLAVNKSEKLDAAYQQTQKLAANAISASDEGQILFGDLHIHSTFSPDAYLMSLPSTGGFGAHPVADACDYARFCSSLDFWPINDHAEASTPDRWAKAIKAVRQCDAISGDGDTQDLVSYLGWEWTQAGITPEGHYGHKNVVLRGLSDEEITTRPIASGPEPGSPSLMSGVPDILVGALSLLTVNQRGLETARFNRDMLAVPKCDTTLASPELPSDCLEEAVTAGDLFRKLDEWENVESMVIPHGTTWGMYTPLGSNWV